MKTAQRRISILFIVILCNLCAQVTASTGAYEGVVTSVDGCEGGFDNGKHKAGEWRWYCNGWRYLYPGYHEVTLRKREAGYATDRIVVTADHAFQPSGTGPAASPQESDGKKAHVGKDGIVVAEAENYASLNDRGHGKNYAKGSSYKGFTGSGYVISPKGDNTSWADGKEIQGFGLKDCEPVKGDHIRGPVRWKSDLSDLNHGTVRLKFELNNAKLFAFQINE